MMITLNKYLFKRIYKYILSKNKNFFNFTKVGKINKNFFILCTIISSKTFQIYFH